MEPNKLRRERQPIFVHSFIDEFELTMAEFRVLGHLARRMGENHSAWPGLRSIARHCRMNKDTAAKAIIALCKSGLVEARISERKRSFYHVRSIPELLNCPLISDRQKSLLSRSRTQLSEVDAQQLSENEEQEVSPSKVTSAPPIFFKDPPDSRIFCRVAKKAKSHHRQ
jgi:hypothetical protein